MSRSLALLSLLLLVFPAEAKRRAASLRLPSSDSIVAISVGSQNGCALRANGTLVCWGHGAFGSLGNGALPAVELRPVRVQGGPWQSVSVGGHGACGTIGGRTFCWGTDVGGGLGQGFVSTGCGGTSDWNAGCSPVPVEVIGGHRFVTISAGGNIERSFGPPFVRFTCGLTESGQAFCWGSDTDGELGDGAQYPNDNPYPIAVATDARFTSIAAGIDHACAIDLDGRAWCWGGDEWGDLGRNAFNFVGATPQPVQGDLRFRQLDANRNHTCGVTVDGDVYCWGYNGFGQLGTASEVRDCSDDPRWPFPCGLTPTRVTSDRKFTRVTTGGAHTCAVADDGQSFCWGAAAEVGQSSPETVACPSSPTDRCVMTPSAVETSERFTQVDAGRRVTCGLAKSGRVLCWGSDFYGPQSVTPRVVIDSVTR